MKDKNDSPYLLQDEAAEKLRNKRILITGGLGMLGSTLAHFLVRYNAKVTLVDSCMSPFGANLFNIELIKNKVKINISDIRDRESIKFLIKDVDIIFNFAAQVSHNDSIENPFLDADINYLGHLNVLENVRKYNPKVRILFSGTRLQFGKIDCIPVDELHPLRPETPYAFNKTVAENMYRYYHQVHGISCVVFRVANPYGERCQMMHSKYSIVNFFIRQAIEDKNITIYGDGEQIRDYIYVSDVAWAFLLASVTDKADGEVFNIGSGLGTKFKDMVKTVVEVVGKGNIIYVPWPDNYLNVETGDYNTDISKISNILNWRPYMSLRQGIKKTYLYYKKYRHYYF